MNLPAFKGLHWHPTTVFWASLLVMTAIVVIFGLIGSQQIIRSMGDQVLMHAAEHNKDIARRLHVRMQEIRDQGLAPQQALERFQDTITHSESFGTAVFLIELASGKVLAHSDLQIAGHLLHMSKLVSNAENLAENGSSDSGWQGVFRAESYDGRPVLLFFSKLESTADDTWILAVQDDITHLTEALGELHRQIEMILLVTGISITLLGFVALRHIGRSYEASLEKQLRIRTEELHLAHQEKLHKARLAAIGQTAAMLTHEMRNPLAAIKLGLSGLNSADYLRERERRRVDIVIREVDRLDDLLSQTLDHVRPIQRSTDPISPDHLLDKVIELLQPLLESRELLLQRITSPDSPALPLDPAQMQQALLNVLKNAIEASPPGSSIDIESRRHGHRLEIRITNQGPLLDAEQKERLFEPFYTTKARGSGLGLSLVKRVMEEHGGGITLESRPELGTCVTLSLPL